MIFPEEPAPVTEQVENMLAVLSLDSPPDRIADRLVSLYKTATADEIRERAIYLLGARRCAGAEEFLTGVLREADGAPGLRQAAYSALIKLGTESAWKTVEQTEMEVAVREVVPGSQADSVGIRAGDALLSYDGKAIASTEDIVAAKNEVAENQEQVVIVARRGAEQMEFTIKPGSIGIWTEQRPK